MTLSKGHLSFALVKFCAFAILYVLIVMQIKLVVVVVEGSQYQNIPKGIPCLMIEHLKNPTLSGSTYLYSVYKGVPPPQGNLLIFNTVPVNQKNKNDPIPYKFIPCFVHNLYFTCWAFSFLRKPFNTILYNI